MRELVVMFLHLQTTVARLAGPAARVPWWPSPCSSSNS